MAAPNSRAPFRIAPDVARRSLFRVHVHLHAVVRDGACARERAARLAATQSPGRQISRLPTAAPTRAGRQWLTQSGHAAWRGQPA